MNDLVDLAIVGAGPVGLFAAFYAGMRQMSVKVIDSHYTVGGQLTGYYPTDSIYDIPGYPAIQAERLVQTLRDQAEQAAPQWCLSEEVEQLHRLPDADGSNRNHWGIVTNRTTHRARSVVLALGKGALRARLVPASPFDTNSTELYTDPSALGPVGAKRVVVLLADNQSVTALLSILAEAQHVTLLDTRHRPDIRASVSLRSNVTYCPSCQTTAVQQHPDGLAVTVQTQNGQQVIQADAVLCLSGLETSLAPALTWGLTYDSAGIRVDETMQTSQTGIYAVGDIVSRPGKVKLIAVGFAEAATAINHIKSRLDPSQKLFPGYSTSVAAKRLPRFRG